MYFLVDVIAVIFVLGLSLYGLKIGFFKSTVDVVLVLVCLVGAGALSYLTVLTLQDKTLWLEEMQNFFMGILGDSKISGLQATIEQVAFYLGFSVLIVLFYIPYSILLNFLRKIIVKIFDKINSVGLFGFFDKLLGFLINFIFSAGTILFILAFIHGTATIGPNYAHELILSSEVLSIFYESNPLNFIFENFADLIPVAWGLQ